jgi:transposase, IS30 family
MAFGRQGSEEVPESAREAFLEAVRSGARFSVAATMVGVTHTTGNKWARAAGIAAWKAHCGNRYSAEVREAFWTAVRAGAAPERAAVSVGVSRNRARAWVTQAGFVPRTPAPADPPVDSPRPARAPLSFVERYRLEQLLEEGCSPREAATVLGRHCDTIDREISRGQTPSGYRARVGQDLTEANRARPKLRHLEARPALLAEVVAGLKKRHSPEQIAGRLREDFPDDPEMWVSHETSYQAIYVQPRGELAKLVKTALRTGRTQRKPRGRNEARGRLKDMINISERPAEAEDRAIPGHLRKVI